MLDLGGTLREASAEDTLAFINPLLVDFGITRLADITDLDNLGIPTYVAIRPNAKSLSNSQGKGLSVSLARVSALMEAIEIWHGENLPPAPLIGSYLELKHTYPLIKPDALQPALSATYIQSLELAWAPVVDLIQGQTHYLPQAIFNQDRTAYWQKNAHLFWPTTNGLASGNTASEALCHALFELIERHCAYTMPPHSYRERAIDLATIPPGHARDLVSRFDRPDLKLTVTDIRNALDVPCFYALIDDGSALRNIGLFGGYGCHFNAEIAFIRAVTEAAQSRLTYISGVRDDIALHFYKKKKASLGEISHYIPFQNSSWYFSSLTECLNILLKLLYNHGHPKVLAYELTKPEIGIPVYHVVIPSLIFNPADHIFRFEARI